VSGPEAAAADEAVAAVLEESNRYRAVSGIAREAGLSPWQVRAALSRLDIRGVLDSDHSTGVPAYQLTAGARRERKLSRLCRVFQGFIEDGQTPPGERTETFTVDGAAFYRVTPLQLTALLALARDLPDVAALNEGRP
jgi:hypothetical protein